MNRPLVSVIMPVYNSQDFIKASVGSIVSQTYANWELLICDDGSTDNSYKLIEELRRGNESKMRVFKNETNLRLLKTRNRLLKLAVGELITFQDSDDYSDRFRLERMVKEFSNNSRLGLLSSQVGYITRKGELMRISKKPTDHDTTLRLIYSNNVIGGSMMMIRKCALESVGGKFREYFDGLSYQDYDLSFLIAQKYESYSLSDVLYYYRQHDRSSSKIVSVDRLVAKQVVIFLAKQRLERGSDDLMEGRSDMVDSYFEYLCEPYRRDSSMIYREYAANFMYNQLYKGAIQSAWESVKRNPLMLINWMTLQYCVRKTLLAKLSKCQ